MNDVKLVIATTSTGDGNAPQPGERMGGVTPAGLPNLAVHFIGPAVAISVRNAHLFLLTLVAFISTGSATGQEIVEWASFGELLYKGATMAGIAAAIGALKDFATLFGKLEQRFPFLTGNV